MGQRRITARHCATSGRSPRGWTGRTDRPFSVRDALVRLRVAPRRAGRLPRVEKVVLGDLVAELETDTPGTLRVRLTGRSASRETGKVLAPLFDRALATARGDTRALVMHFERLEYFNSSTIAALVQFIRATQQAGVDLTVVYDPTQKWQAMSFDALRRALRPFGAASGPGVHFTTPAPAGELP
jgi:hypothetical protein